MQKSADFRYFSFKKFVYVRNFHYLCSVIKKQNIMCYTTYNVCSWNEELGWEFLCWITSTNRDDLKSQVVENMKYFGVKKVLVYKLSDDEVQQGVIYQIRKSGKLCIYKNPEIVK